MMAIFPERRERSPSRWIVAMSCSFRLSFTRSSSGFVVSCDSVSYGAAEADAAGAHHFLDSVRPDELLEGVEVFRVADHLEHDLLRPEVGDPRAVVIGEGHQLAPPLRRSRHSEERDLA